MIISLMSKTFGFVHWFIVILIFMSIYKNVYTQEKNSDHLNYKGKYTSDIRNYEIIVPQLVNKDGNFISHLVSHRHSKRSTKELDFIFYKIPIAGKDYLVELTPNRKLISPGAVVEIHTKNESNSSNRGSINVEFKNETIGKILENLNIRKLKNTECHFSGHVKGENISKAALSTCYGLAGFIKIKKGFYTIEPVAEHDPFVEGEYPHILYKAEDLENSTMCQTMELMASLADQVIRKRRESNFDLSLPLYVETLIVLDKTLINYHQDSECENYVLTVFNMAFNLFNDASLGLMMTLTIVRIIRLEVENDEMNLRVNADAEKTLKYFQTWQHDINPGDDSHPNHHDIAVLITRVNVCYAPSSCGLLGLTTIGKACDPKLSAALCEDNGLRLGFVIAHEIGHLLGAGHDLVSSTSNGTDENGIRTVMHPHVPLTTQTWSKSSQAYFKAFFDKGMGYCFLDEPEEHKFNIQDLLPGVMYNADFQCKHLIDNAARECEMGSTCDSLNCYIPGYACIVTHTPPADGTRCGENMWCHNSKCLMIGERPGAVDGNWGDWSAWSDCSRTCGSGVSNSERHCDKPPPSQGGKNCVGERKRYKICAAMVIICIRIAFRPPEFDKISEEVNVSFVGKPCETGRPSFRDIQCGEFDDWIYPEDGKIHKWKAHYSHDDNPCILYCISEEKQIAALRPRVIDGTMCYRGIRDICVGGSCKNLPCDLHFESNSVEDACGVCHGDGTGCEFSEGIVTLTKLMKGLTKLVNIPSGTRNIKVEEMAPTLARIIVRDQDTKDIYVRGKSLGMFNIPGSQAWLGMIKKNQEALNIPGPVTKPLSIWIQRLENVTVKWSMALPAEQQRKPEFAWDFLKWGPCSAKCGPGTQKSEPSCVEEKAGLVEDTFCADLEIPLAKVRPCEVAKCEPRWMVGDWRGCEEPESQKKERKRVVYCIKAIGEGEGESQIIPDSNCPLPKPHGKEPCEIRQKRENTEYYNENDKNFLEERSTYSSDVVEFGFHKKYDDYLKHFAALSVPQRKSETIPFHLVSSPHFKNYFRVLETHEDYDTEPGSNNDLNGSLPNITMEDSKAQGKVSPDFYKNTFSGHQIDVSHVRSMVSFKDKDSFSPSSKRRRKKNISEKFEKINSNTSPFSHKSNQGTDYLINRNVFRKLKLKPNNYKRSSKMCNLNKFPDQHVTNVKSLNNEDKGPSNLSDRKCLSSKENRSSRSKSFRREYKKNFNYTSPNLTFLIDRLSEGNDFMKNKYMKLIEKGGHKTLPKLERDNFKNYHINFHNPKGFYSKLSDLLKPGPSLSTGKQTNKVSIESYPKNCEFVSGRNLKRLGIKEFDGSGIRKLSFRPEMVHSKTTLNEENGKIGNFDPQELNLHEKSFYSNPFDPLRRNRFDYNSKKFAFKEKNLTLRDLLKEKRTKRLHVTGKRNKNKFRKRKKSIRSSFQKRKLICNCRQNNLSNVRKRSSRKWRKPKYKDTSTKSNKEISAIGCGTETRNYLNNLFRDTHPKPLNKQKSSNEKVVIKTGELVIDRDPVEDQHVDIFFLDNEEEGGYKKVRRLPQPLRNEKLMSLRGQKVFDLYQQLQPRSGRNAYYRANKGSDRNAEKIEINVKIPEGGKDQVDISKTVFNATTKSSENTTTNSSITATTATVTTTVANSSVVITTTAASPTKTTTFAATTDATTKTTTVSAATDNSAKTTNVAATTVSTEKTTTVSAATSHSTATKAPATATSKEIHTSIHPHVQSSITTPTTNTSATFEKNLTTISTTTTTEEIPPDEDCSDYDIDDILHDKVDQETDEKHKSKKKKKSRKRGKPKLGKVREETERRGIYSKRV